LQHIRRSGAFFDLNGTLQPSEDIFYTHVSSLYEGVGAAMSPPRWRQLWSHPANISRDLGSQLPSLDMMTVESMVEATRRNAMRDIRSVGIPPAVRAKLRHHRAAGQKVVLVTDAPHSWMEDCRIAHVVNRHCDLVITGSDVGEAQTKPDRRLYDLAFERSGVDPADAEIYEDSERGLAAALAATEGSKARVHLWRNEVNRDLQPPPGVQEFDIRSLHPRQVAPVPVPLLTLARGGGLV
jgi:beta-phosphoglucomutase-like phosphatase (HAD superfamily)